MVGISALFPCLNTDLKDPEIHGRNFGTYSGRHYGTYSGRNSVQRTSGKSDVLTMHSCLEIVQWAVPLFKICLEILTTSSCPPSELASLPSSSSEKSSAFGAGPSSLGISRTMYMCILGLIQGSNTALIRGRPVALLVLGLPFVVM